MMRRLWLSLLLVLGGCAHRAPLPESLPALDWPLQLHVQRQQAGQTQDWLLVIQREGRALRWSLLDPLGLPLARQRLLDRRWQNDGLLPPNPEARELFAALLFTLTPEAALPQHYAAARWQAEVGQRLLLDAGTPRWRVFYRQPLDFDLETGDGPRYRVQALAPAAGANR